MAMAFFTTNTRIRMDAVFGDGANWSENAVLELLKIINPRAFNSTPVNVDPSLKIESISDFVVRDTYPFGKGFL